MPKNNLNTRIKILIMTRPRYLSYACWSLTTSISLIYHCIFLMYVTVIYTKIKKCYCKSSLNYSHGQSEYTI